MLNYIKLSLNLLTATAILNISCANPAVKGPDIVVSLREVGSMTTNNSFILIDSDPNVLTNQYSTT